MNDYVQEIKLSLSQMPVNQRNREGLRLIYRTIYKSLLDMGRYDQLTEAREAYQTVSKEV